MSDKPNPFSDVPANPYQSPTFEAYSGPVIPLTREQVRMRLLGPAIGLGVSTLFWFMYLAFAIVVSFLDSSSPIWKIRADPAAQAAEFVGMIIGMLLVLVLFTVPGLLMLVGAVQMLRVRGYGWCWAGVITGVLPCTMCFLLSIPFGIWGIVILYDARVKVAFQGDVNPFQKVSP